MDHGRDLSRALGGGGGGITKNWDSAGRFVSVEDIHGVEGRLRNFVVFG